MKPVDLEEVLLDIRVNGLRSWLLKELTRAFEEARKGKLKTYDEHHFEVNWAQNVATLRDAILARKYEPNASVAFVVFDPMVREIFAAPFRDRVVHHLLYNMQAGWWDARFINDSYSCRVGKGTLYGIKRAQGMMMAVTENDTKKARIIKLDIKGYFMSLPREKLYERIMWGLKRQFKDFQDDNYGQQLFSLCAYLWKKILFDDPVEKAWRRGSLDNWDPAILPPEKSLFTRPPGRGIVIGNLTSQLVSNIYLDQLDRYIYYDLGYKYYGRYVDDFFIMVPEEKYQKARKDVRKIEKFLKDKLELTLHPKKRYYQEVRKGMQFLGARIYPHCIYPSDRLQRKFFLSMQGLYDGWIDLDTIISYIGIMKHMDSARFIKGVIEKYEDGTWGKGAAGTKPTGTKG